MAAEAAAAAKDECQVFPPKLSFPFPPKMTFLGYAAGRLLGGSGSARPAELPGQKKRNGPDAEIKDSVFPPNLTFDAYAACRSSGGVITDAYRLLLRTPPKLRWQYFLS